MIFLANQLPGAKTQSSQPITQQQNTNNLNAGTVLEENTYRAMPPQTEVPSGKHQRH